MFSTKRFLTAAALTLFAVSAVMGQAREMTVEEAFLQESIEMMIIRETSRSENLDQKMIALEFIGQAIARGNTGPEVRQTLEFLSLEGIVNRAVENGRLVNNFPAVRREAARYLGMIGTEEARTALIRMSLAETEPMVLQEAVRSLGIIGLNPNDETASAIAWAVTRFDTFNPDNMLALSAIDAFQRIARSGDGNIRDPNVIRLLMRISEGPYIRPVQARARSLLMELAGIQIQQEE